MLTENPYESHDGIVEEGPQSRGFRPYIIASLSVPLALSGLVAIGCWSNRVLFDNDGVWIFISGRYAGKMFSINYGGLALICLVIVSMALFFVNGLLFIFRRTLAK